MSNYFTRHFEFKAWWFVAAFAISLLTFGINSQYQYETEIKPLWEQTLPTLDKIDRYVIGVSVNLLYVSGILMIGFGVGMALFAVVIFVFIDERQVGIKYE